ncbi:MAG: hypothetical protein OXG81_10240 [Acidobacteria bacterium]|nr:hypothetical protein [Acidobacteriota bacterium]
MASPAESVQTLPALPQPRNLTPLWEKFGVPKPRESPVRFLISSRNGRLRGTLSYDPRRSRRPQGRWRLEAGRPA